MTVEAPVSPGRELATAPLAEHKAWSAGGTPAALSGIAVVIIGVVLLWLSGKQAGATATTLIWAGIIVVIIGAALLAGLTPVVPGQARVIQLFGKYRGTV